VTPARSRIFFQDVFKEVIGTLGSLGDRPPPGNTNQSALASPNRFAYQRVWSTSAVSTAPLRGIVRPAPASVFDFPTVRILFSQSIWLHRRFLISESRMPQFRARTRAG